MPTVLVPSVCCAAAAAASGLLLGRAALLRRAEARSSRTYELPVDRRAVARPAVGAAVAGLLLTGSVTAAATAGGGPDGRDAPRPRAAAAAAPPHRPAPVFRPAGAEAGGRIAAAAVDGSPVRVWTPEGARAGRLPAVLVVGAAARTAAAPPDLYAGFADRAAAGTADRFAVVTVAGCPNAGTLRDIRAAVARAYPPQRSGRTWGVLGEGAYAGCAVRGALAAPGSAADLRFAAAAGVAGRYPHPAAVAGARPSLPVLLVSAARDGVGRAAAARAAAALHGRADVRRVDTVRDFDPAAERRRLFGVAARFLTESARR